MDYHFMSFFHEQGPPIIKAHVVVMYLSLCLLGHSLPTLDWELNLAKSW